MLQPKKGSRCDLIAAICWLSLVSCLAHVDADEFDAARRGKKDLFTHSYIRGMWSTKSYDEAWLAWGLKEAPQNYEPEYASGAVSCQVAPGNGRQRHHPLAYWPL